MATSGSTNYVLNREQLFQESLEILNVYDPISTLSYEDMFTCARTLNLMVKAFEADGMQLWAQKDCVLFLTKGKHEYTLSSTGDHATETHYETALSVAGVATDTTINVDTSADMTVGDYVGIELDSGAMHWDTVATIPDGTSITINTGLPSAAAVDSVVYSYTTRMPKPLRVQEANLYTQSTANESDLQIVSRDEYWRLGKKTVQGTVNQLYFDPKRDESIIKVYLQSNTSTDYIKMVCHFPFEDMDAQANDLDFPQYWYEAVVWNLAVRLMYKFGGAVSQDRRAEIRGIARQMKEDALNYDTEDVSIFFQPRSR